MLMVLGILVVTPTFRKPCLGRGMPLGPLEFPKAFNTDMLCGGGSDSTSAGLMKDVGNR
jgi:hypothetical protein